jgi:hypothetical protein
MSYELHNVSKCSLNSDLLSYIKLRNQILITNQLIRSDDLSKISSLVIFSFPLTFWSLIDWLMVVPLLGTSWKWGWSWWEPWSLLTSRLYL